MTRQNSSQISRCECGEIKCTKRGARKSIDDEVMDAFTFVLRNTNYQNPVQKSSQSITDLLYKDA